MKEDRAVKGFDFLIKKVLIVAIGSGLLSNALYLYGLSYYQGYIKGFGFDYYFFPIEWSDTLIWTYFSSRNIGVDTIGFWSSMTENDILIIFLSVYLLSRAWMENKNNYRKDNKNKNNALKALIKRKMVFLRRRNKLIFNAFYIPLRWLLVTEQSLWAFMVSYLFLIVLVFMPIFIYIWVYFPLIGERHGVEFSRNEVIYLDGRLCGNNEAYWDQCVTINVNHTGDDIEPMMIKGRLVFRHNGLLGLYTKDGPIMVSEPKFIYHKTYLNGCYSGPCL